MSGIPKGENKPKIKPYETDIEATILTIVGGMMLVEFGDMQLVGYGLVGVGIVTTLLEASRLTNPYKALFENMNLQSGKQVPRFISKRKTPYGYCLKFSLPYGMSSEDFIKKKTAIEEYLNHKIEISYHNYRVLVKVYEKELEKSPPFQLTEAKGKIEFPIGIRYGGEVATVDLNKVVHLLIAGETGSGKSTLLRGIITNIILSDKKVILHLIDLKGGTEFNVFRKSSRVKTFSKAKEEAEERLGKLIGEVERRTDLFYQYDVVDISEYNKLKKVSKLNYQVVIIDEFADLQKEKDSISSVETLVAKARACGIHLIISTQRPDMKILNGRIKANVPCVIGLKTINGTNSRIIIDQEGLEKLRGEGHGLLKYSNFTEFQSFYITNQEARDLVKHTYVDKNPPAKKKEGPKEIKDFEFLEAIVGGKK